MSLIGVCPSFKAIKSDVGNEKLVQMRIGPCKMENAVSDRNKIKMVGYYKIAERNGGCVIPDMKVALAPAKSIFLKVSGFYFIF